MREASTAEPAIPHHQSPLRVLTGTRAEQRGPRPPDVRAERAPGVCIATFDDIEARRDQAAVAPRKTIGSAGGSRKA